MDFTGACSDFPVDTPSPEPLALITRSFVVEEAATVLIHGALTIRGGAVRGLLRLDGVEIGVMFDLPKPAIR